mgnify:CR=1 FL=1|tara:strand:+ start:4778 stop:5908 length:1131 start_codon:yes stop_codon:yes gene_type:complete
MTNTNIIHITHTNPYKDSRILNITESVSIIDNRFNQFIIGINKEKRFKHKKKRIKIISLDLKSKSFPIFFKTFRKLFLIFEFNAKVLIKCISIRPKIIHCHDLAGLYIGIIAKLFLKSKFIFDAHELEAQQSFVTPFEHILRSIYEFLPILLCDHLITVSPSIALWYKWKGAKKISIIFNKPVCEINKTKINELSFLEKSPPPNDLINIIYIGVLEKNRSIEKLLNLFESDKKFNLYFLGEGLLENTIKEKMKKNINIFLHPFVHKDKVTSFIKGFDYSLCLIEPSSLSSYFSMPNKLFQSLASGVPVIVFNNPDISNYVRENNYGIVIENINDIKNSLIKNNKNINYFRENLIKNKNTFTWEDEFKKMKNIYQNL